MSIPYFTADQLDAIESLGQITYAVKSAEAVAAY